jgi:hypothetical protein
MGLMVAPMRQGWNACKILAETPSFAGMVACVRHDRAPWQVQHDAQPLELTLTESLLRASSRIMSCKNVSLCSGRDWHRTLISNWIQSIVEFNA